ncbi:PTS transporter subunit EIIC, partial [Borreliella garinii]
EALVPVIVLSVVAQSVNVAIQSSLGSLFPEIIMNMFRPVLQISDTLVGTLMISFIVHILWFCGLHGTNVIIALLNPIILTNLDSNIR